MLRRISRRLTYANVMSTIAVFGVLAGGTAYAANTVFSTDIVDGEVKSVDIANNSIHSGDVLDNTINTFDVHSFLGVDVVDNTLTGADINESTLNGVNAALLDGLDSDDTVKRGLGTNTVRDLYFFSDFMNTSSVQTTLLGQIEIRTTGIAGQFMVCKPSTAAGATLPFVVYSNGARTAGGLTTPGTCSSAFDPGAGGDFQVSARRTQVFGVHSGDSATSENYSLIGFGELCTDPDTGFDCPY